MLHLGERAGSSPLGGHHDVKSRLVPEVITVLRLMRAPCALDLEILWGGGKATQHKLGVGWGEV